MPLSDDEEAAFAAIVAHLGNPERRRLRRLTMRLGATVLLAFGLLVLVAHWPLAVFASFSATFVLGLAAGWVCLAHSTRPR